jgi:hypothetical protein
VGRARLVGLASLEEVSRAGRIMLTGGRGSADADGGWPGARPPRQPPATGWCASARRRALQPWLRILRGLSTP